MKLCTTCGHVGEEITKGRGSVILALVLLCFFLVPGIIYILWCAVSRYDACAKCGATTLVPMDSPVAKAWSPSLGPVART